MRQTQSEGKFHSQRRRKKNSCGIPGILHCLVDVIIMFI